MTPPWIVGTYVRATPQNSCESLGIAIYQSMRNSAGAMGGGKKRRNKKERAKTKKELRDVEV